MTAARQLALLSPDEYLRGETISAVKHEYVGGMVYAMAGATNTHNRIATNAIICLGRRLDGKPCQPFDSNTKVRVRSPNDTRFYYPDVMVVCQSNAGTDRFQDQPVVVIEVLSPSTRRIDEGEKRNVYFSIPSLSVYLLVEQGLPAVIAYRRTDAGFVRETYEGIEAVVPLEEIEVQLPLAELYKGVGLASQSENGASPSETEE